MHCKRTPVCHPPPSHFCSRAHAAWMAWDVERTDGWMDGCVSECSRVSVCVRQQTIVRRHVAIFLTDSFPSSSPPPPSSLNFFFSLSFPFSSFAFSALAKRANVVAAWFVSAVWGTCLGLSCVWVRVRWLGVNKVHDNWSNLDGERN